MGAVFESTIIKAKDTAEAIKKAKDYQDACCHEMGHGAYTGHLGTAGVGVDLLKTVFATREAAEQHIEDKHQKWELPMLAPIRDAVTGNVEWMLAGWMSS